MDYTDSFQNAFDPSFQTAIESIQDKERKTKARQKLFDLYTSITDAGLWPEGSEPMTASMLTDSVIKMNMIEATTKAKNIQDEDIIRNINKDYEIDTYAALNEELTTTPTNRDRRIRSEYDVVLDYGETYDSVIEDRKKNITNIKKLIRMNGAEEYGERIYNECQQASDILFEDKLEPKREIASLILTEKYLKKYSNYTANAIIDYENYKQHPKKHPEVEDRIVNMRKNYLTDSMGKAESDISELSSLIGDKSIASQLQSSFTDNNMVRQMAVNAKPPAKNGQHSMTALICSDETPDKRDMLMMCLDENGYPHIQQCRLRCVVNNPYDNYSWFAQNDEKPTHDGALMFFDTPNTYASGSPPIPVTAGHMNLTVFPRTLEGLKNLKKACEDFNNNSEYKNDPQAFFDEMDKIADPEKQDYELRRISPSLAFKIKQTEKGEITESAVFSPHPDDPPAKSMLMLVENMTCIPQEKISMPSISLGGKDADPVRVKIPSAIMHSSMSFNHDSDEIKTRAELMSSFLDRSEADLAKDIYAVSVIAQTETESYFDVKSNADIKHMNPAIQDIVSCGLMAETINTVRDDPYHGADEEDIDYIKNSAGILDKTSELFTARTYADFAVAIKNIVPDKLNIDVDKNNVYSLKCDLSEEEQNLLVNTWEHIAALEPQPDNMQKLEKAIGPEVMQSTFALYADKKFKEQAETTFLESEINEFVSAEHKKIVGQNAELLMDSITATTANFVSEATGVPAKDIMPELSEAIYGASMNSPDGKLPSIQDCMANLVNTETTVVENTCQTLGIKNPHVSNGNLALTSVTNSVMQDLHSDNPSVFVEQIADRAERNYQLHNEDHIHESMQTLCASMRSPLLQDTKFDYAAFTKRFSEQPTVGFALSVQKQDISEIFETTIDPEKRKLEIEARTREINESIRSDMDIKITGEKTPFEKFKDKIHSLTHKKTEEPTYGKNQSVNIRTDNKNAKLEAIRQLRDVSRKYEKPQTNKEDMDLGE
jgi:hypothetical protein